jgi:hypothetical protein
MSERSENEQCEKCGRGFNRVRRLVDWCLADDDIYLCVTHSKQLEKVMREWLGSR